MKVDILVLFLTLRRTILVFTHGVWCWHWVSHRWLLLCLSMFHLFPLFWKFLSLIRPGFYQMFLWIYWYDYEVFIPHFVYLVNHIYWRLNVVPTLHPQNKSHLIIEYGLFLIYCCIHFVNILLRILAYIFIRANGLNFSFFVGSLSDFGIRIILDL